MKLSRARHAWKVTPAQAVALQRKLASRVRRVPLSPAIRLVAGLDAAFTQNDCVAAVVLWDMDRRTVIEKQTARAPLRFPYIPGLLSFREAPALLAALRKLRRRPDVLLCDGQGLAHPRRFGIACHLGVLTGLPSVGCAKSRLVGGSREPGRRRGARAALTDGGKRIGTVLRTRDGVRPVFVSVGHLADLPSAEALVLRCAVRYRLPAPIRLADQLCGAAAHPTRNFQSLENQRVRFSNDWKNLDGGPATPCAGTARARSARATIRSRELMPAAR